MITVTKGKSLEDRIAELESYVSQLQDLLGRSVVPDPRLDQDLEPPTRPTMAHVVRYFRRPPHWYHNNLGGATVLFRIDYLTEMVRCYVAVCSFEDNFNKRKGRDIAYDRLLDQDLLVEFPLRWVDDFEGLKPAFLVALESVVEESSIAATIMKKVCYMGEWV